MIPRILEVARDRAGSVIVEFAAVLPVLLLVLVGVLQFGLFFYQYTALTEATAAGVRQLSISSSTTPYSDTVSAIENASCNLSSNVCILNPNDLTITVSVSGQSCTDTTGTTCYNLLTQTPHAPITVTASYSCSLLMPTGWVNLTGICPLTLTLATLAQLQ